MAILPTGFATSMIFPVFALAKEEMSSLKTCMMPFFPLKSTIDHQVSENVVAELYSNGAYDSNSKFASRKSISIFSIYYLVLENRMTHSSALHRTMSAIVVDESLDCEQSLIFLCEATARET